jgi:hypothetical protein
VGFGVRDSNMQKKKFDWIRIAYVLQEEGELSLDHISWMVGSIWRSRSLSRGQIAAVISSHRRKGFSSRIVGRAKVYSFEGELPELHPSTLKRWREKLTPLKGG